LVGKAMYGLCSCVWVCVCFFLLLHVLRTFIPAEILPSWREEGKAI